MTSEKIKKPRSERKRPSSIDTDSTVSELLAAQAEIAPHHPAGTMKAEEVMGRPTVLANRSNGKRSNSPEIKLQGPKNPGDAPIAVVSPDGTVYPFSGEVRDRMALLGYDVTYLYNVDDARKVIAHNERMHREDNVDRVIHGLEMAPAKVSTSEDAHQFKESIAVAFSPEMLA